MKSPGYELGALFKLHFDVFIQAHFPVSLSCYDLSPFTYNLLIITKCVLIFEEGDGQCVCFLTKLSSLLIS